MTSKTEKAAARFSSCTWSTELKRAWPRPPMKKAPDQGPGALLPSSKCLTPRCQDSAAKRKQD